jgi:small subunit ribosomal protein S16
LLRIRLSRIGKRKQPSYRIVVTDQRHPREGAHLEIIGHYNPLTNPATITLKEDRAIHWLQVGAQPSDTAAKILSRSGIMEQAGREAVIWSGKQVAPGAKKRKAMESAAAAPPAAPVAAAPAAVAVAPAAGEVPTPEPTEEAAAAPEVEAQASE